MPVSEVMLQSTCCKFEFEVTKNSAIVKLLRLAAWMFGEIIHDAIFPCLLRSTVDLLGLSLYISVKTISLEFWQFENDFSYDFSLKIIKIRTYRPLALGDDLEDVS